jgi:hypothetical protein
MSGGFFSTPQFERYMRYKSESNVSHSTPTPSVTVIDATSSDVYYIDLGPGVAMWPTRQLQIHFEGGGMAGLIHNRPSLATPAYGGEQFVLAAFAGAGVSYRVRSMPWAIGFDYRFQGVPYGGFGSAESAESGVELGHKLFGFAHSFGISAIFRMERDGEN